MINLNLTNHTSNGSSSTEFYKDKLQVKFLSGIKTINLIVGANNSRKSRFLRKVISLEERCLISSKVDLNQAYHLGSVLVEKVRALKDNGIGGSITSIRTYASRNEQAIILQEFFDQGRQTARHINSENVSGLMEAIVSEMLCLYSEKQVEDLEKKLIQLETLCELILYLYNHIRSAKNKLVSSLSYPEGPFRHMEPDVPGVQPQGIVPFVEEVLSVFIRVLEWVRSLKGLSIDRHRKKNIYIPVLRTSRTLVGHNEDIYSETIKLQHFKGEVPQKAELHTGLALYEKIKLAKNGLTMERNAFSEFEQFVGQTFFKSKNIHIVAYSDKSNKEKTILVTIPGQKEDVPIYDLGDGVQGIINLLFPIFTAEEGDWIFIDEPENHLHPGYQHIFVQAIAENEFLKKKNLRYFINTHSNHILSESFLSAADTEIFVFSNRDSESSTILSFDQNQFSTLELLGVMNTSVFVTNCTVWVEGITDRFYLRSFLDAYCKTLEDNAYRPKEGFDFSFIEYAGKNLVHYDFDESAETNIASFFLNTNIFLLADSDFDEDKHAKYEKIKRHNFLYQKTNVPEIENLLPFDLIKLFLTEKLQCDQKSIDVLQDDSKNLKLGEILKGITKKGKTVAIEASFGGTLSPYYKSMLSRFVHDRILSGEITWVELASSKRLKDIVLALYGFIKEKNRR